MQVGLPSLQRKKVELPSVATGTDKRLGVLQRPVRKAMLGIIAQHFKYFAHSAKDRCTCGKAG